MAGDEGETKPVRLKDRRRPCFQRGQENAFIVSYLKGVGDLTYFQIWHDNSGLYNNKQNKQQVFNIFYLTQMIWNCGKGLRLVVK